MATQTSFIIANMAAIRLADETFTAQSKTIKYTINTISADQRFVYNWVL